jgi:hypothetical protein
VSAKAPRETTGTGVASMRLISPLVKEMAGRPGAKDLSHHLHLTLNRVSRIATTIVKSDVATMTSAM